MGLTGRIAAAVADVRLDDVLTESTGRLSEGYKRRDVSVQALLNDLPALVLDEPTDGLIPIGKTRCDSCSKTLSVTRRLFCQPIFSMTWKRSVPAQLSSTEAKIVVDSDPNTLATRSHKLISVHRKLS